MTEKGIAKILPNDMVLSPLAGYTDAEIGRAHV